MRPLQHAFDRVVPFRVRLVRSFRGVTAREGVLLQGPGGWGEFAPFADYPPAADAHWLASAVEAATSGMPPAVRGTVAVNAILPTGDPGDSADWARSAIREQGCHTIKLKVADPEPRGPGCGPPASHERDLARVSAVREVLDEELGPGRGRIRIDANGRWTVAQAETALLALAALGLDYVEQPCATVAELLELRRRGVPVAVAVDETIRGDRQVEGLSRFADVAVVKPGPLGGWRETLQLCSRLDLPVVVSGAMETSVGLARDVAVAAALPGEPLDCGLGTGLLLADDLVVPAIVPHDGVIPAGSAPTPDPGRLEEAGARLAADGAAGPRDWLRRAEAAWELALGSDLIAGADLERLGIPA
jgi:o-succinylbenzoate synthase